MTFITKNLFYFFKITSILFLNIKKKKWTEKVNLTQSETKIYHSKKNFKYMGLYYLLRVVARDAMKTKDGSVLLCFLPREVEVYNASSKNCKIMEDTTICCMV